MLAAFSAVCSIRLLTILDNRPDGTKGRVDEATFDEGVRPFLLAGIVSGLYFTPFLVVPGEGRSLLIGSAVVMLAGLPVVCVVCPLIVQTTYAHLRGKTLTIESLASVWRDPSWARDWLVEVRSLPESIKGMLVPAWQRIVRPWIRSPKASSADSEK